MADRESDLAREDRTEAQKGEWSSQSYECKAEEKNYHCDTEI